MARAVVSVADVIACWPEAWRESFLRQNELLAEEGEEPLTPGEYLQCRFEDLEEAEAALEP
jgi:hypothetical protein